jgi:hypothetical protein
MVVAAEEDLCVKGPSDFKETGTFNKHAKNNQKYGQLVLLKLQKTGIGNQEIKRYNSKI